MAILGMPFPDFGHEPKIQDVIDYVAELYKTVAYWMDGNIDSANTREMGGWIVGNTELMSKDGDVGMSTVDTGEDDIRFWAGGVNQDNAVFRVYKSGKVFTRDLEAIDSTITGSLIRTAEYGQRIEMDQLGLRAFDAFNVSRIEIYPVDTHNYYQLGFRGQSGRNEGVISGTDGQMNLMAWNKLAFGGDMGIYTTGMLYVQDGMHVRGSVDFTGASISGLTISDIQGLQSALNNKASIYHSHTVSINDHNHGNPDNQNGGGGTYYVY